MEVSKELIRGCLLYDFKVGLTAAASSRRICQAFGVNAVNERTARHWFQKFRSGDVSLSDDPRSGRPHVLDDEARKTTVLLDGCFQGSLKCKYASYKIYEIINTYMICQSINYLLNKVFPL